MNNGYIHDRKWADAFNNDIGQIIRENLGHIVSIDIAPVDVDTRQATDMVVHVRGGAVGVRLRRGNCKYRELTIRSTRKGTAQTEIDKLRGGFGDWYLYCWEIAAGIEWMLVDLAKVRGAGLLDMRRKEIMNPDGITGFIAISRDELTQKGCVVNTGVHK